MYNNIQYLILCVKINRSYAIEKIEKNEQIMQNLLKGYYFDNFFVIKLDGTFTKSSFGTKSKATRF